jgi:3-oxoacid CoA-transferase subunit B
MSLTISDMAGRVAREFAEGMVINLGTGLPTECSEHVPDGMEVFLHSEQGVIGFGPVVRNRADADPYLVNAGRKCVSRRPGMAFVDHAESFGLLRGGRVAISVLGGLQVSRSRDISNCWLTGRPSGLMGGAQDFIFCARKVIVMMRALTKDGSSRLVEECTMPVTGYGKVDLVVTDIGVFGFDDDGFVLQEIAPGLDPDQAIAQVAGRVRVSDDLTQVYRGDFSAPPVRGA